ncbi:MAG TPA: NAD(P)H-hydrate dehydratase [Syntrophales bacterium]|nr:NAD(P)H-hydrate dehydratase [Syntrophales bacterium]HON22880.1 NAD(P)H-hydrate dehydratase [Syntrophales bacterium]HOU77285.1 NAD(P)H-hydrate dehydratase [Syntrophales bacterium]HPC32715.1 NAD(P)H-hydrate dehydratase [Syntrophales bacterium]HQG34224.1 NAD(P)H-hydrate dehydratase [Syntrophales bacterium]
MKISRVEEIRAMDRRAVEELGISEEILMENAGQAAVYVLEKERGIRGKRYVILCGAGNNGGDGFVVARKILSHGGFPQVYLYGDPGRCRGAAKTNLDILSRLPLEVSRSETVAALRGKITHADGVVDALFGTGLDREVGGLHREVIAALNGCRAWVLSLDIPSGVNGETGEIMGDAVRADATVTFGLPKPGNVLYPGCERGGKLYLSHISFPPALYDREDLKIQLNDYLPLPVRGGDVHKGAMGDVLFIAGARNYLGAPYFAAMAFLRAGGGYARLAVPATAIPAIAAQGKEPVFIPLRETPEGSAAADNFDDLCAVAALTDAVVIGPGLSLVPATQTLVRRLVPAIEKPLLIDGDGLTAVAGHRELVRERKFPTVLTPHAGEMGRLTGLAATEIRRRRIDVLQEACAAWNAYIVLKGAHSLIGCPDGRVYVNMTGNPGMATAGSGDVLAGAIAAMYGLGLTWPESVRKGVYIHGRAGDLAAAERGEDGVTAGDILACLPQAVRDDRREGERLYAMTVEICP